MERIGPYEIVAEVGRGGMGVVYRALDPHIGRQVAVKVIRLGEMMDPEEQELLRSRLFREARAAGILKHPGIVTIYYVGEEQGVAFIAMEFVNGPTLEKLLLADAPLSQDRIRRLLWETAAALDHAHKKGVVHRDIKPANIMLEDNELVKICDFGIAKGFTGFSSLTQTGTVIGTPHYMPPEQIQGKVVDARADQYALAVIAFQILAGRRPFQADSIQTLFFRIMADPPEQVHEVNPTLPAAASEVMARGLAKEPSQRYPTCVEFVTELLAACDKNPEWSPLSRKGLTSSGATPARTTRPPSVSAPAPPQAAPVIAQTPARGSTAPMAAPPAPAPPPQPVQGRCRNCGGAAPPGHDLCAFCDSFGLAAPAQPAPAPAQPRQAWEPVLRAGPGMDTEATVLDPSGGARQEAEASTVVAAPPPAPVRQERPPEPPPPPYQQPYWAPPAVLEPVTSPPNRRPMLIGVLVAAACLVVIVLGVWLTRETPGPDKTESAPPLKIVEFTANRQAVAPGEPAVLRWKVTGTDGFRIEPGVGAVTSEGETTVRPQVSTTYTLFAVGSTETLSAQVAVNVIGTTPPPDNSQQVQAKLTEARGSFNRGLYEKAIAAYQAALRVDSGNRQAREGLAEARTAQEAELRLSRGGGRRAQEALGRAQRLYNNGDYQAAIAAYNQALASDPGNVRAKQGLAAARTADEAEKRLR